MKRTHIIVTATASLDFFALTQNSSTRFCIGLIEQAHKPDRATKNPGCLNDASCGNGNGNGTGTVVHQTTEYFKAQSDAFMLPLPYPCTALAMPDLISGIPDVLFDFFGTGIRHFKDGKLRTQARALYSMQAPSLGS